MKQKQHPTQTYRVELPVLLYADITIPLQDYPERAVRTALEEALGPVGLEDERGEITHPKLKNALIYLTDHTFPVSSLQHMEILHTVTPDTESQGD